MWYLTPVNLYDMASMEFWLEHMAGRGRFLVSAGPLFSVFSRETPQSQPLSRGAAGRPQPYPHTGSSRLL